MAERWSGPAHRLVPGDLAAAAKAVGVPQAALVAVLAVEARGSGFDAQNRPIILREGHVYHRQLAAHRPGDLPRAVAAGLAWPRWDRTRYERGQDRQYAWLEAASRIDPECAFRSISVGLAQILGSNHAAAGYDSAVQMFEAFKISEQDQLAAMLRLIRKWGLIVAMQRGDWATFARKYNGPANTVVYSGKLAVAFRQAGGAARAFAPVHAASPTPARAVASAPAAPPAKPRGRVRIFNAARLNDAELERVRQAAYGHSSRMPDEADDLNAAELARIRGDA